MAPLFNYRTPVRFRNGEENIDIVALDWHALLVTRSTDDDELKRFVSRADEANVYVFEAWIDAQGTRSIVYVGSTKRGVKNRWTDARSSLGLVGCRRQGKFEPWSDVLDLTVRWAAVDESFLHPVETVLIAAHAPAFNNQHARPNLTRYPEAERLIVMNIGDKGRLMPVVAGAYYSSSAALWPDMVPWPE